MRNYVVATHKNCLGETVLIMITKCVFIQENEKLSLNYLCYSLPSAALHIIKFSKDAAGIFNPFALRKAKIVYNFGLSECKRVKICPNYKHYF